MFSICLIYSNKRLPQAEQVVAYLQSLPYFETYEKLQICDQAPNYVFPAFTAVVVERATDLYCRAHAWQAGIAAATKRIVIIIDCDRIAHPEFFVQAALLTNNQVAYCARLYQLLQPYPTALLFTESKIRCRLDHRVVFAAGTIEPAKNPMSGCVAFCRNSYLGMSEQFVGWGFNDTDYYTTAYFAGQKFRALDLPEYHLYHEYEVSCLQLAAMNLWNAVRYYDKWGLPYPEQLDGLFDHFKLDADFVRQIPLALFLESL